MEPELLLDKNQIIESFKDLPDKVSSEDLIERILFIKLVNERVREAATSSGTPNEEFKREFEEFKQHKKVQRPQLS